MRTTTSRTIAAIAVSLAIGLGAANPASAAESIPVTPHPAVTSPVGATAPVDGTIASGIVFVRVQADTTDGSGKTFIGDGMGLLVPGVGVLMGDIYTDDIDRLYRDTVSFHVNAAAVYVNVSFADADGNDLGSLHAGGVGTVVGFGGGGGSWN